MKIKNLNLKIKNFKQYSSNCSASGSKRLKNKNVYS